jgi:hypothetical protein
MSKQEKLLRVLNYIKYRGITSDKNIDFVEAGKVFHNTSTDFILKNVEIARALDISVSSANNYVRQLNALGYIIATDIRDWHIIGGHAKRIQILNKEERLIC